MSGRTRNMAADAAHLAGLGAGPTGSASGHRAHRRLRAVQGRAATGALERSRPKSRPHRPRSTSSTPRGCGAAQAAPASVYTENDVPAVGGFVGTDACAPLTH